MENPAFQLDGALGDFYAGAGKIAGHGLDVGQDIEQGAFAGIRLPTSTILKCFISDHDFSGQTLADGHLAGMGGQVADQDGAPA